jgi:hypothetical protein
MAYLQRILDDPVALGTWALALATTILAIATIVFVRQQTKALTFTLRTDALSRFTALWDTSPMRARRRELAKRILTSSQEAVAQSNDTQTGDVVDFFEDVGALLRKDRLDFDLVWQAFSETAVGWWEAVGKMYADDCRIVDRDSSSYSEYQYLVGRLAQEDARRVPGHAGWSSDDVKSFLESERDLQPDEPVRVIVVKEP